MEGNSEKKGYVWYSMRYCFWGVWILNFITMILPDIWLSSYAWILSLCVGYMIINTFVCSILHLNMYKRKASAIIALIFSSLWLIYVLFALFTIVPEGFL